VIEIKICIKYKRACGWNMEEVFDFRCYIYCAQF